MPYSSNKTINNLDEKTTPINADSTVIGDSADSNRAKKTTWANIKATLKAYFDTLYPSGSGTSSGTNTGDQTSIVGITGTKSQFDTAVTDGNFLYVGDITVPVKASGAELDTGTDDAKFATAKAINDSHNVPSVAPGTSGNIMTSNGTDWTSTAPTSGWTLVSYSTATAASEIEKTSLDLDTDKAYKVIIRRGKTNTNATCLMQVNGTATGYIYSATGLQTTTTGVTAGSTSATSWSLSAGESATAFTGEYLLQMGEYNATPDEMVMMTGTGMVADGSAVKMATIAGTLAATNVTSLKISSNAGTSDWRMWIFKANI